MKPEKPPVWKATQPLGGDTVEVGTRGGDVETIVGAMPVAVGSGLAVGVLGGVEIGVWLGAETVTTVAVTNGCEVAWNAA